MLSPARLEQMEMVNCTPLKDMLKIWVKIKGTVMLKGMFKNKVEYKDMVRIMHTWSWNMKAN